jgi:hypothetical protein
LRRSCQPRLCLQLFQHQSLARPRSRPRQNATPSDRFPANSAHHRIEETRRNFRPPLLLHKQSENSVALLPQRVARYAEFYQPQLLATRQLTGHLPTRQMTPRTNPAPYSTSERRSPPYSRDAPKSRGHRGKAGVDENGTAPLQETVRLLQRRPPVMIPKGFRKAAHGCRLAATPRKAASQQI